MNKLIDKVLNLLGKKGGADTSEILKGGATAFLLKIFGILSTYALTLLITNKYGADIYGNYSFFVASIRILGIVAICGIDIYLLRYISKNSTNNDWREIINLNRKGVIAVLSSSFVFFSVLILGQDYFSYKLEVTDFFILLLAIGIIPFTLFKIHNQSFRARKNTLWFSLFDYISIPFFTILILLACILFNVEKAELPVIAFFSAVCLAAIFSMTKWRFSISKEKENLKLSSFKENVKEVPQLYKLAFPFLLASSSLLIGHWIVQLMLKVYSGNSELGIYDAALKVAQLTMLPLMASNIIAAPKFSEFFTKNQFNRLANTAKNITNSIVFITVPILIVCFLGADFIVSIFGKDFEGAALALRIIIVGQFFNSLTGPVGVILQMTENQSTFKNIIMFTTVINIAVGVLLIPILGAVGAAITNMIFQILTNGTCTYFVYKKFGFLPFGRKKSVVQ